MKLPIVSNHPTTANPRQCSFCAKEMPDDGSDVWIMLGAMQGDINQKSMFGDDAFAFLSLSQHSGGHVDIVQNGLHGQADIGFCSCSCLRGFFNFCVDKLEATNVDDFT